ncbi:molecular chaperone [Novosphingobium sp. BL-8A]|uniref:fimbrial biogenesis chaperone n=1 Tax=Novosphingobium sp. BL-8A TaxID=3127639 RepID=UPI003756B4AE
MNTLFPSIGVATMSVLLGVTAVPTAAQSPGSLLIWPISPVIEGNAPAAALWLENPGKAPITLQVRIFAWTQQHGEDLYADQQDILGTPPILTIDPGQRQLIRLTRMVPPPDVPEKPYRIIVDQIPTVDAAVPAGGAQGASVSFRMRYSLPLFSQAKAGDGEKKTPPPPPQLGWRTGTDGTGRFIEIRNSGTGHARLSDLGFSRTGKHTGLAEGLFGYVLPGATMRWPLPAGVEPQGDLIATLNGRAQSRIERLPE